MCKKLMFLVCFVVMAGLVSVASAVEIKVDWGNQGTLDSSWTEWAATSGSKTVDGVQFTLSNSGLNAGAKLRPWMEGVGDKLIVDCLSAEDESSSGTYTLQITNLAAGEYEMVTYHNMGDAKNVGTSTATLDGGHGGTSDTTNTAKHLSSYTDLTEATGLTVLSFTSPGTSDTVTITYTHTGDMPAVAGFTLQTTNPAVQFASAASADFESVSPAIIEVTLNNAEPGQTYSADYTISDGTATAGDDYAAAATGTVVFNPGETSRNISIDILNDGIDEDDETIMLALSNAVGVDLALGDVTEHTYTIIDPRPSVGFAKDAGSAREDDGSVDIPVVLCFAGPDTVTVDYAVTGGTATGDGVDYTLANGTLTFNPGQTAQNISVTLIDDEIEEADETIVLTLSNQTNAKKLAISEHTFTIFDKRFVDLKIDLALPYWTGTDQVADWDGVPIPGTLKEGWIPWCKGGWGDMYGHGGAAMENIDGTGVSTIISTVYGGLSALKVCGMCMPTLNGGTPYGSPIHDPICNSWFQVVDKVYNPSGDIVMALYDLPAGEYELYSYHNNFECRRLDEGPEGTPNCCDLIANPQPLMPSITALSLDGLLERYAEYDWWPRWADVRKDLSRCQLDLPWWDHPVCEFMGTGVEMIDGAYNVPISQVTQDSELVPSLVRFRTNGSAVHIVYESGCCVPDGIRPSRSGGKAILNAFELRSIVPEPLVCPCLGDLAVPAGQVDLQDLDAMVNMLVAAGPPFIVPVEFGHCGDMAEPMLQVDLQDLDAMVNLLVAAGPPFIVPCE